MLINQLDCRDFTICAALMLIGCSEREFLKNGLKSDVNKKVKSDLIREIDFSTVDTNKFLIRKSGQEICYQQTWQKKYLLFLFGKSECFWRDGICNAMHQTKEMYESNDGTHQMHSGGNILPFAPRYLEKGFWKLENFREGF